MQQSEWAHDPVSVKPAGLHWSSYKSAAYMNNGVEKGELWRSCSRSELEPRQLGHRAAPRFHVSAKENKCSAHRPGQHHNKPASETSEGQITLKALEQGSPNFSEWGPYRSCENKWGPSTYFHIFDMKYEPFSYQWWSLWNRSVFSNLLNYNKPIICNSIRLSTQKTLGVGPRATIGRRATLWTRLL